MAETTDSPFSSMTGSDVPQVDFMGGGTSLDLSGPESGSYGQGGNWNDFTSGGGWLNSGDTYNYNYLNPDSGNAGYAGGTDVPNYFGQSTPDYLNQYSSPNVGYNSVPISQDMQDLENSWNKKNAGEKAWSNAYAKTGSEGLADFVKGWSDLTSPLQPYVNNPIISTLMSMNPITALAKTAINGPGAVGGMGGSMLGGMLSGSPIGAALGGLAGAGATNYALGNSDGMPSNGQIGGTLGGLLGYSTGNPYGGTIGGYLGSQAGNYLGSNSGSSSGPYTGGDYSSGSMSPMLSGGGAMGAYGTQAPNMMPTDLNSGLAGGLAALYLGNQNNKAVTSQINNLNGLFTNNSPYATQLRQSLERRDAAAGRRSQYGTREVELQAALAQQAARSAPQLQQLNNQRIQQNNLLLSTLMNNKGLGSAINSGVSGLASLLGYGNASPQQAFSNLPSYTDQGTSGLSSSLYSGSSPWDTNNTSNLPSFSGG